MDLCNGIQILLLFSKLFGTTPEFWMNLQMNYDLTVRKPVVKLKTLQSLKLPLAV